MEALGSTTPLSHRLPPRTGLRQQRCTPRQPRCRWMVPATTNIFCGISDAMDSPGNNPHDSSMRERMAQVPYEPCVRKKVRKNILVNIQRPRDFWVSTFERQTARTQVGHRDRRDTKKSSRKRGMRDENAVLTPKDGKHKTSKETTSGDQS